MLPLSHNYTETLTFAKAIQNFDINPNQVYLCSFDIVSHFTCIPFVERIEMLKLRIVMTLFDLLSAKAKSYANCYFFKPKTYANCYFFN